VAEQTPLVLALAAVIQRQERELEAPRDEIQRLMGTTRRPKINPSRLLKPPPLSNPPGKRPVSEKRSKTRELKIDATLLPVPDDLPPRAQSPPTAEQCQSIEQRFDQLCLAKTGYADLNDILGLLNSNRDEFLAVLEYPHLPLYTNLAENDIREYTRIRKVSAGTRGDLGRRCRDTFPSPNKPCRKLGVSFCEYLREGLTGAGVTPAWLN
jgi:hypothetical protein